MAVVIVARSYEAKDCGPEVVGAMLGVCIGSYVEYLSKEELLDLVGDMYDGIVAVRGVRSAVEGD